MRGLHPVVFPYDRYGVPAYDELWCRQRRPAARRRGLSQTVRGVRAGLAAGTDWAKAHPAPLSRSCAATRPTTTETSSSRASGDPPAAHRAASGGRVGPVRAWTVRRRW
jgi:hypothetical protein